MTRKYRRYTKEFKLEAIRLAEKSDKPITRIARELGIRVNPLYKWKQQREHKQDDAFPGKGKQLGKESLPCTYSQDFDITHSLAKKQSQRFRRLW